MNIKQLFIGSFLAMALTACIRDEALNVEAAIDACTGTNVQFTNTEGREIRIYVNRGSDLSSQELTFTIPDGAVIALENNTTGDSGFTRNSDGTYTATINFGNNTLTRTVTVTSEDGSNQVTYTIRLVQTGMPTLFHFEDLQTSDEPYHILLEDQTTDTERRILQWCSGNPGFELTRMADTPFDYPTVRMNGGCNNTDYCAKLETKDTGSFGAMVGMYLATGNLFTGSFDLTNALTDALGATKFGVQFYQEPVSLRGWYRYQSGEVYSERGQTVEGKQDTYNIYAMFYEADDPSFMLDGANGTTDPSIVLLAELDEADAHETDTWSEFEIPFLPMNGKTVDAQKLAEGKYKLGIVFSSSRDGGNFNGAVGSTLWIDEVELVCK